jgi:transcriptional regulator GlxA family with amidase domain
MTQIRYPAASVVGAAAAALAAATGAARPGTRSAVAKIAGELDPYSGPPLRVAFLLGDEANVMDTAGPWEVFQDARMGPRKLFDLFTVAPTRDVLTLSGGLQVKPLYQADQAPQPDIIVVPAHLSTETSQAWLRQASQGARATMSVCTGAFHLAAAGLLDGLKATTHHLFLDAFEKAYPQVELLRDARFVDNGRVATAGGLTSGIDLALHMVKRLYGTDVAVSTARYMEHYGPGWQEASP